MTPSTSTPETTMVAPTPDSPPPSTWTFNPPTPKLHSDVSTQQRPRAWERLPKSPFARRRKGKKVWKRYETSTKTAMNDMGACLSSNTAGNLAQNDGGDASTHNAKRLRSRDVSMGADEGAEEGKASKYVTTLRDQVVGTPRRKAVRRRSLRPDRLKSVAAPVALLDDEGVDAKEQDASTVEVLVKEDVIAETVHLEDLEEEDAKVGSDPVQPMEGPLAEDVDEALSSPLSSEQIEEDSSSPRQSPDGFPPEVPCVVELRNDAMEDTPTAGDKQDEELGIALVENIQSPTFVGTLMSDYTASLADTSTSPVDGKDGSTSETLQVGSDASPGNHFDEQLSTEVKSSEEIQSTQRNNRAGDPPRASVSPQRRLRRSSRRSSIKKDRMSSLGAAASTDPSSRLDEISEVEAKAVPSASVTFSVADREGNESPSHEHPLRRASQRLSDGSDHTIGTLLVGTDLDSIGPNMLSCNGQDFANTEDDSAPYASTPVEDQPIIHKDDHHLNDESGPIDQSSNVATIEHLSENIVDEGNMRQDIDGRVRIIDIDSHHTQSPQMKTRSGARFSDDTTMLKDFLSRAQARKLVKEVILVPVPDATTAATSPRRSQRNALAPLDSNSPSPRKAREPAQHPGTPPSKPRLAEIHREDNDERTTRGSPVRRSSRKRLPAPAKTATGAPSFIPVRRADGTDPVVLQKSIAQELALVTQTNTRRNKGQAKPPAAFLKNLPVEVVENGTKGGHALRNCKTVGWDQKLVYYQDGTEAIVDVESKMEEKRPKARRLRGLGAGNGTPAPKRKMADMLSSNGTPGTKRGGRIR
ncbi:MAG: hypothetical protein Q9168_007598 [Polycauliona sp. 1 TL-2023]